MSRAIEKCETCDFFIEVINEEIKDKHICIVQFSVFGEHQCNETEKDDYCKNWQLNDLYATL